MKNKKINSVKELIEDLKSDGSYVAVINKENHSHSPKKQEVQTQGDKIVNPNRKDEMNSIRLPTSEDTQNYEEELKKGCGIVYNEGSEAELKCGKEYDKEIWLCSECEEMENEK